MNITIFRVPKLLGQFYEFCVHMCTCHVRFHCFIFDLTNRYYLHWYLAMQTDQINLKIIFSHCYKNIINTLLLIMIEGKNNFNILRKYLLKIIHVEQDKDINLNTRWDNPTTVFALGCFLRSI